MFFVEKNFPTAGMNLLFSILCFFGYKNQNEKLKELEEKNKKKVRKNNLEKNGLDQNKF